MKRRKKIMLTASFLAVVMVLFTPGFISKDKKGEVLGVSYSTVATNGDTFVSSFFRDSNYGQERDIVVDRDGDGPSLAQTFLKFGMATIPQNATLNSANILLKQNYCDRLSTGVVTVAKVNGPWSENTLTYRNRPGYTDYPNLSKRFDCESETKIDITPIYYSWTTGVPNYGIVLYGPDSGGYEYEFASKEGSTAYYPKLIVGYSTPAPAAPPSGTNSNNPTSSNSSSTSKNTPITATDVIVDEPTFMSALLNGKAVEITEENVIEVDKDKVTIKGAGVPGNKIVLTVDKFTFETTVNAEGYWELTFETNKLPVGTHKVEAQAKNSDLVSEKVLMLSLKKVDFAALIKDLVAGSKGMDWLDRLSIIMFYVGPFLQLMFWVGIIIAIVLLVKRHNKKKKEKLGVQNTAAPATENPAVPTDTKNPAKSLKKSAKKQTKK